MKSKPRSLDLENSSEPLSCEQLLGYLLPRIKTDPSLPRWPPDVFGICMSLLLKSGAYTAALSNWPPGRGNVARWASATAALGERWRMSFAGAVIPEEIKKYWNIILSEQATPVNDIRGNRPLCQNLLRLCAIADEACAGVGLPIDPRAKLKSSELKFYNFADKLLLRDCCGSTLGLEVPSLKARVLPKMHTPQNGLTTRSLSHHLALCTATDIRAKWILTPGHKISQESLNLLIVPWPIEMVPAQFKKTDPLPAEMRNMPRDRFGFFTVESRNNSKEVVKHVTELYAAAEHRLGRIDWVVLPEAALTPEDYSALKRALKSRDCTLISGVGTASEPGKHGENRIDISIPLMETLTQHKHHRWRLDFPQIKQYGLGSRLNPERGWWEHIDLSDRELLFLSLRPWMVMSVLICEDLARPDPVGDLVRAVGPNLVLAILMDGPQLKERWGARYATTLADDPGCSVLTITSTGMSKLSQPQSGTSRSRVMALWKDPLTSSPTEIELEPDASGLVISLSVRYREEWSADGRTDNGATAYILLSGIHSVAKSQKNEHP